MPIIVLAIIQIAFAFERERAQTEQLTLAQAAHVSALIDAQLQADLAVMEVLATADVVERRDWPLAFGRAREVAALNPHWRNVILSDLEAGQQVFSLQHPYSPQSEPLNPTIAAAARTDTQSAGEIARDGPGCPCVYLHMPIRGEGRFLLSVGLDPQIFRAILGRTTPAGATAAIVDHDGTFIARSRDHDARVGTPATPYVRNAVASGESSGLYEGTTYEGLRNFTAFTVSPSSGWSAHIAVPSAMIATPRSMSFAAIATGVVIALLIAAGLIFWALRDLAERRRAEERLAQTQKLEAIGQLTGGVAHDFNNLLTVMIGGLNMLLRRIEDPKQREIAEHMLESAKRGDKLTKQLLAFSRGQQTELAPVDLHVLVPGMEELLRRSIDPGMALNFNLDAGARWIRTDANQLELAILNLVINARDAMPDGGEIEIITRPAPNDQIEIAVRDTGIGMPKDVADRAMEPFFTTKPAGKGTGLGLAQVFGAARQSGGQFEIDSSPGRGTTMRLFLPRTEAPPAEPSAPIEAAPAAAPQRANGQRVLVVDDEAGVRAFIADTLRESGYVVSEAAHAGEALPLIESDPPDVLVTDYSMPGMTGLELAERALAALPGLRVLIVSGYADAEALQASASRPAMLRKPFDEDALCEAVRAALS